jgi:hypothetical protein
MISRATRTANFKQQTRASNFKQQAANFKQQTGQLISETANWAIIFKQQTGH